MRKILSLTKKKNVRYTSTNSAADITFFLYISDLRVANDKEMQQFECDFDVGQLISDDKLLKRIRRRNFLDICKDALSYNVLHKSNENTSVSAKKVDMAETSQPIVEHN